MSDRSEDVTALERRPGSPPADAGVDPLFGADLAPGSAVGGYLVEELVARGGFATIYRAHHATLGRVAALKLLHQALSASPEMLRRFEQEARAVNLIRHRNIVDIYELGALPDGRPYCVMEWLDGHDLDHVLRARGPFLPHEALALMEDLCAALAAAHAVGVIHRDLKASNVVLVGSESLYEVKLVDFGIAKLVDDRRTRGGLTATGHRLGTPSTMAPEQILGVAVDARTDIYALGLLLYQLLTGALPFTAERTDELEELHLHAQPPRLSAVAAVPAALDGVLARCLAKRPEDRWPKVDDFLRALRSALAPRRAPSSAATLATALGLHFEARLHAEDGEVDDEMLDDLEAVMATARRALADAGLTLVVDTADTLFGAAPLPLDDNGLQLRRAVVRAAHGLLQALLARDGAHRALHVALAVHAGTAVVRRDEDGALAFVGGDLLCFADWVAGNDADALAVTAQALAGIEDDVVTAPIAGHDDRRRLLALR